MGRARPKTMRMMRIRLAGRASAAPDLSDVVGPSRGARDRRSVTYNLFSTTSMGQAPLRTSLSLAGRSTALRNGANVIAAAAPHLPGPAWPRLKRLDGVRHLAVIRRLGHWSWQERCPKER